MKYFLMALFTFASFAENYCYKVTIKTSLNNLLSASIVDDNYQNRNGDASDDWSLQIFDQNEVKVIHRASNDQFPTFNVTEIFCSEENYQNLTVKVSDNDYLYLLPWTWFGTISNDIYEILTIAIEPSEQEVEDALVLNKTTIVRTLKSYRKDVKEGVVKIEELNPETQNIISSTSKVLTANEYKEYEESAVNSAKVIYSVKVQRVNGIFQSKSK